MPSDWQDVQRRFYDATADGLHRVQELHDPTRINAVVMLTDGYNEDEHDNDRRALLAPTVDDGTGEQIEREARERER